MGKDDWRRLESKVDNDGLEELLAHSRHSLVERSLEGIIKFHA